MISITSANNRLIRSRVEGSSLLKFNPLNRTLSVTAAGAPAGRFVPEQLGFPVRVVVEFTSRCNARCAYCSQQGRKKGQMPDEDIQWVIDESEKNRAFELSMRGGEAMLHPHFAGLWGYAASRDFLSVNLITNGMQLNRDALFSMLNNPRSKIIVSLDGPDEINSQFRNPKQYRTVMEWLLPSLEEKPEQLVVLSTLYKNNLPFIPEFASYLAGRGLRYYHITLLKRLGENHFGPEDFVRPEDLSILEDRLDEVAQKNKHFQPSAIFPIFGKPKDMLSGVPIPLFTEHYCGTGMRITANGTIGISQMIHFTPEFRKRIGPHPAVSLGGIGKISERKPLDEVWKESFELRKAQAQLARQNFPYYLGF